MTKIFVIFNPTARGEKSQRLRQFLEAKQSAHVTLAPTQRAGDATQLAANAGPNDTIVAAGGDGTINEVVNGLLQRAKNSVVGAASPPRSAGPVAAGTPLPQQNHPQPKLGLLPLGTVNVFAKELRIPTNTEAAWRLIEAGQTRTIDLGCAEAAGKRRYFVQLAGVGFDARAVRAASWELKKKVGPLAYVWAGLKTLGEKHAPVEGGAAIFIGNGRFYGGKIPLFPKAKLDDGLLDVCVLEKIGFLDLCRYGPAMLLGKHTGLRGVRYFQTAEFSCRSTEGTPFELDGEDAGDIPVTFTVKPRALRVIIGEQHHAR